MNSITAILQLNREMQETARSSWFEVARASRCIHVDAAAACTGEAIRHFRQTILSGEAPPVTVRSAG